MVKDSLTVVAGYALSVAVLSLYGVEVCPYIEGLGYLGVFPILVGTFALAFIGRTLARMRVQSSPLSVLRIELLAWAAAGLGLTFFDTLVLGFPLGSGIKVLVGCLALGFPLSTHQALLVERDLILEARADTQRRSPTGPERSIPGRLYRFVLLSQLLLVAVLLLLVSKDFHYVADAIAAGESPAFGAIAVEIGGAVLLLLGVNGLAGRRYADNLKLLLAGQLEEMNAVAAGNLEGVVPVIANDEMARIGDRTNEMIEGLRERERVKSAFGKLVSPQVAEALLGSEGGAELGGREVEAVVLFTDLRNFTALSERFEPQEIVDFLNEYFTMIVEAVHAEGGVLDKFIGDAAMAVFGLEGGASLGDAPDRALRAALAMRRGLGPVNARLVERGLPQIDSGVGLHLGTMVAGNIGSEDRLEYTVIGDVVNTASRLEGLCKEAQNPLLLSSNCYDHLSEPLQRHLVSLGGFAVKGKAEALSVFGLIAIDRVAVIGSIAVGLPAILIHKAVWIPV